MSWWLAKLLGMEQLEGGEVESARLSFANLQTPYHVLAFLAAEAMLIWAVIFFYRREPAYCPRRRKAAMAAARILGLNILLLILAGPILEIVKSGMSKNKVAVLLDVSESMNFRDAAGPGERLRSAYLLGLADIASGSGGELRLPPEKEREMAGASRLDLARGLLRHRKIGLIEKLKDKYDVEVLVFARAAEIAPIGSGDDPLPPGSLEGLKAEGKCTELGRSLRAAVNRLKGQPIAALIPITDGGSNKDEDPILVADDIGVPIYPIGIGAPDAKDIQVVYMFAEDVMFADDSAPVYVRVRHRGYGGETVALTVKKDGEIVQERQIRLSEVSPEETFEVRITPKEKGTFEFSAEVPARPDEINADNNSKSQKIRVTDEKLRVLMVEGDPSWEFRFMKAAFMRDRKRMDVKVIQRSADPDLAGRPGSEYLSNRGLPQREQLFKFDVVVIGNVKSDFFTKKDMENLSLFVQEEGGAVWFVAGPNHMPDTYKDTEIERLLPIEFEKNEERTPAAEISEPLETPFKAVLTPEGRVHSLCRLDPDPRRNAELWDCMPDMYWFHRAVRLKPAVGAEVLLAHGTETGRGGSAPLPLAVVSPCGKGRVLYFAVRDMWRMRFPSELGPEKLERFYGHAVQYLGLPHLMGESRRVRIAVDSREYSVGDTVRLNARILDKSYMPSGKDRYAVEVASADGGVAWRGEIVASPQGSGNFRGEIQAKAEGDFKVRIVDEEEGEAEFRVAAPRIEMDDPGMKIELLKEIARRSGGEYFPPERAGELPDAIRKSRKKVEFRIEDPLWDAPIMAVAFSLLMGIEWFMRKRSDLC